MNLEIGAGSTKRKGFTTLDINPDYKPDIVASADKIPLKNESVDYIIAVDVLEHCEWQNVLITLKEWYRVLKKNGIAEIHTPDFSYSFMIMTDRNPNWNNPNVIGAQPFNAGNDRWEYLNHFVMSTNAAYNQHRAIFTYDYMVELLKKAGFTSFERIPQTRAVHVKATK